MNREAVVDSSRWTRPGGWVRLRGGSSACLRLFADDRGAVAIEYGLIAAFLAVAIIAILTGIGQSLSTIFGNVVSGFSR